MEMYGKEGVGGAGLHNGWPSHPLKLRIIAILAMNGPLYLSDIAKRLGVSRALAKFT
jgi:hypothetical protein